MEEANTLTIQKLELISNFGVLDAKNAEFESRAYLFENHEN